MGSREGLIAAAIGSSALAGEAPEWIDPQDRRQSHHAESIALWLPFRWSARYTGEVTCATRGGG